MDSQNIYVTVTLHVFIQHPGKLWSCHSNGVKGQRKWRKDEGERECVSVCVCEREREREREN